MDGTSRHDPHRRAKIVSDEALPGVRAGSALIRWHDRLLLAQDDEHTLFWVDPRTDPAGLTPIPLRPETGPMAKAAKPDFEAATILPDQRVLVIGSGSAHPRRGVVLLHPDTGEFEVHDAGRIYDLVSSAIGHGLNIEGLVPIPQGVRVFHRGNSGEGNATADLAVDPDNPATAAVTSVSHWNLGSVPGEHRDVPLTFTDATVDHRGRHWYLAAAEDTPNAIDDGPVVGAALGIIGGSEGAWTSIRESDGSPSLRKAEGLVVDEDLRGGWLVTDPDDEHRSAELCRLELSGWDDD